MQLFLFPTEVWNFDLEQLDNEKLSEIILEKEKTESSQSLSNVGGWQSKSALHYDKGFSRVVDIVKENLSTVCSYQNYKKGITFTLADMWANVNRYKDSNMKHLHGRSDWSWVYYVLVPQGSGKIIFCDPRIRRAMYQKEEFLQNFDNPSQYGEYKIVSSVGKLIIFPSYLEHYVESNLTQQPRISISGNIDGYLGT